MQATCVSCHNQHEDSVYKHWKEGDVPGILEIIRPLDRDVDRTRAGLRGTFLRVAAISGSLLALTVFVLVADRRRRRSGFPA
jgi:adenylate cyclase